jgi:ElaB/YqjD/DUF883 family membrane-anchored ribosome-binding protein
LIGQPKLSTLAGLHLRSFIRHKEDIMNGNGDTTSDNAVNRDKFVQDMRLVISDAEELLRATASQAGEQIAVARERIQDSLHQAKVKLAEADAIVRERARQAARYTDEYVRENPWRAIGVAAGIGLLLGVMLGRR